MFAICAGMYRSGSTLVYQVVSDLVETHKRGKRLGFLGLDALPEFRQEVLDCRWRSFKTHQSHAALTALVAEGRAVCFYTYRDIRDVVYSFMHKMACSFDDALQCVPSMCLHDRIWKAHEKTLVQRYETWLEDRASAVRAIAAHLDTTLSAEQVDALCACYSLDANRACTCQLERRLRDEGVRLDMPDNALARDPDSELHWNHIRTGEVGTWRLVATERERDALRRVCSSWLIECEYETSDEW